MGAAYAPVDARRDSLADGNDDVASDDPRFRALLSEADWAGLPIAVRRRFSKHLTAGKTAVYSGQVVEIDMSRTGWLMAQALRPIGGPLPVSRDINVPSIVTVTEDLRTGGQIWTRLYVRRHGFPQVIHSSKSFTGPTGLEEHVGCGIGMTLTVAAEGAALVFRSAGYFVRFAGRRFVIPRWATPGALTVTHAETADGGFLFRLEIVHPLLGRLVRQSVVFRETNP